MELAELTQEGRGIFIVLFFILGAVTGSFCNVCVARWPHGQSVIKPRSRCPKCLKPIAWYDNIPLISWFVLRARCRHCGQPISFVYPLVELITALLFVAVFLRFGLVPATPVYLLFCAAMVVVTFQDLADWTIPDEITLPGIPIGLLVALLGTFLGAESGFRVTSVLDALGGVLLGGGIILAMDRITVWVLRKPGMGFGDVKLLAMVGAFLGWLGAFATLMLASIFGSVFGLLLIMLMRRKQDTTPAQEASAGRQTSESSKTQKEKTDRKSLESGEEEEEITIEGHYLPFGPWLALGALVYMFFGPELIAWYIHRGAVLQGTTVYLP